MKYMFRHVVKIVLIYTIISHDLFFFSDKINYNKIYDFYFLVRLNVET
jgi:hypothetical protein